MRRSPIYLDNNATTPVDPRVMDAMMPHFMDFFGNAASIGHSFGRSARVTVEKARASIAGAIGAESPNEIVFTSGATESDNIAIKGVAEANRARGKHIITVATEHKAVLDTCQYLERRGFDVTYLPVQTDGLLAPGAVEEAITPQTILVSVMAGNNEIGVIQDIEYIGKYCRSRGVIFHTDATQFIGKLPFHAREMYVDLASFSAHKMYGPKGCGGLYVRKSPDVKLESQMHGGGHEAGMRSGTLNVTGIVGLATAMELCHTELERERISVSRLRDRLYAGLLRNCGLRLNGHADRRLPGHLSVIVPGIAGSMIMNQMQEIAISSTSACSSATATPSHVLKAIGLNANDAASTLRFGIGRFNTLEEIDYVVARIPEAVQAVRNSPFACLD